ncbi:MAG TPA: hypothetical protein VFE65_11750 [Pseudonocardia sp.]|nr:hypothetical protein [Pseudonocardia sp.]
MADGKFALETTFSDIQVPERAPPSAIASIVPSTAARNEAGSERLRGIDGEVSPTTTAQTSLLFQGGASWQGEVPLAAGKQWMAFYAEKGFDLLTRSSRDIFP